MERWPQLRRFGFLAPVAVSAALGLAVGLVLTCRAEGTVRSGIVFWLGIAGGLAVGAVLAVLFAWLFRPDDSGTAADYEDAPP
jgi:hypothetical protein